MKKLCLLFIVLYTMWVLLSGHFNAFFFVLGGISVGLSVWLARCVMLDAGETPGMMRGFWRLPGYVLWLEWQIILSSLSVVRRIWQFKPTISPDVSWIQTSMRDELGLTIFANSITLTPGTVAVDVDANVIQVHALVRENLDELREGDMHDRSKQVVGFLYQDNKGATR